MIRPIHLLFICAFATTLNAQDFMPATLTYTSGQTATGSIWAKNWKLTPQTLRFKTNSNGRETAIDVSKLASFSVSRSDGHTEHYIRRVVWIDKSPVPDTTHLARLRHDTLVLQTLVEGAISLYVVEATEGERHFFVGTKDSMAELIYKKYIKQITPASSVIFPNGSGFGSGTLRPQNKEITRVSYQYRQQLSELAAGNLPLATFTELVWGQKYLIGATQNINEALGSPITYIYKDEKNAARWSVALGSVGSSFGTLEGGPDGILNATSIIKLSFKPRVVPSVAVGYEYYFRSRKSRLSLLNELALTVLKNESDTQTFSLREFKGKMNALYVDLNTMLRIYFPVPQPKAVFIAFGLSNGLDILDNNKIIETELVTPVVIIKKPLFGRPYSFKSAPLLGLGARLGAFGLEVRYGGGLALGQKLLSTRFVFLWASYRL